MFSRRDFLASLSALAGSTAALGASVKAFGQSAPIHDDTEIKKALNKVLNRPFDIPDNAVQSAQDLIAANVTDLGHLRDLIDILVPPSESGPILAALDDVRAAAGQSASEVNEFVNRVEGHGLPRNTDRFFRDTGRAVTLFDGPFRSALSDWASSSPAALNEVPPEVGSDPRFANLVSKVCDSSSYGGGEVCPPVGEFLTAVAEDPANPFALIIAATALVLAVAILLIFLFTSDDKQPCVLAAEFIDKTVDNPKIPEEESSASNYKKILEKAFGDSQKPSQDQRKQIIECIDKEIEKEKDPDRKGRLRRLNNALTMFN